MCENVDWVFVLLFETNCNTVNVVTFLIYLLYARVKSNFIIIYSLNPENYRITKKLTLHDGLGLRF